MSAPTAPIPISANGEHHHNHHNHHHRRRSSISSDSSSDSPPHTPPQARQEAPVSTSPSSPILSYLSGALASPTKSPGAQFPGFKRFGGPLMEEDEEDEAPVVKHARRQSIVGAFPTTPGQQMPGSGYPTIGNPAQHERGAGLLRRLSLGGAFQRPQVSVQPVTAGSVPHAPASAVTPGDRSKTLPARVPNRRATVDGRSQRRAPSPMGERILKGHFDGFN